MEHRDSPEASRHAVPDDARFTPCSTGHVERIVRLLHEHYPQRTVDECRAALAGMYGCSSWEQFLAAAQRDAPSRFDEDETRETVEARFRHHYRTLLAGLGGVTAEMTRAAGSLDEELLAPAKDSIIKRYDPAFHRKRAERAHHAYHVAYAREVLLVARPTARDRLAIAEDDEGVDLSLRVELLPNALGAWLGHHRPHLAASVRHATGLRVRQHAQADLLNFSLCWGEVCAFHAAEIPTALQIYPVALCAKWYAWNACMDTDRLAGGHAVPDVCTAYAQNYAQAQRAVSDPLMAMQLRFMLAQPREDFRLLSPSAREQQMRAGYVLVKRHLQDAAATHPVRGFFSKPAWGRAERAVVH